MSPRSKTDTQALVFYFIRIRIVTHRWCWQWTSWGSRLAFSWVATCHQWIKWIFWGCASISMILPPWRLLILAVYVSGIDVTWCRSKWARKGHILRHKWGTDPWSSQGEAGLSPQTQCCQLSNRLSWATFHGSTAVLYSPTVLELRWTCLLVEGNPW